MSCSVSCGGPHDRPTPDARRPTPDLRVLVEALVQSGIDFLDALDAAEAEHECDEAEEYMVDDQ